MKPSKEATSDPEDSNLDRLIKRKITATPHSAVLRFPKGFARACLAEVQTLLGRGLLQPKMAPTLELTDAGLEVRGLGWRDLVALATLATTVREVLWDVGGGRAGAIGEVKSRLTAVHWPLFFAPGTRVAIRANSTASQVFHEGKLADLAAKILAKHGIAATERAETEHLVDLRLVNDRLRITLSLNGRALYMRRYRREMKGIATVKEDIAAAAVQSVLSFGHSHGLEKFRQVLIPYAGSGTLAFEAAIALRQIPPWVFFGALAAEQFPCFPMAALRYTHKQSLLYCKSQAEHHADLVFACNDIDPTVCAQLEGNAQYFNESLSAQGIDEVRILVTPGDIYDTRLKNLAATASASATLILLNPPYGARLGERSQVKRDFRRLAEEVNTITAPKAGFAFAPSDAVADAFLRTLRSSATDLRPFNHGGRTVYLALFCTN